MATKTAAQLVTGDIVRLDNGRFLTVQANDTVPRVPGQVLITWADTNGRTFLPLDQVVSVPADDEPVDAGRCGACGDPLAWIANPGSDRTHAWSGRRGLPERPYDHAAA